MKLLEVIELLNSKQKKMPEIYGELGCSRDLLKGIMKDHGYTYDNHKKIYAFNNEGDPVDIELEPLVRERQSKQNNNVNKSNKNQKIIRNKSDKVKVSNEQKTELSLTESEIKFVKELAKGRDEWTKEFELNYDFSKLPVRKPTKKTSYEISMATYERFEEFAATTGERHRMSKNDLVEIALLRLIKDFS